MEVTIRKMRASDLAGAFEFLSHYNLAPKPDHPGAERSGIGVENGVSLMVINTCIHDWDLRRK